MKDKEKQIEIIGSDVEWMRRYREDDSRAFESIYSAYSNAVYGYLVKRVKSVEERDDLFQKIWLKFHRSREQWSSDYPLLQWLFVISRSVLIDHRRSASRTPLDRAEHPEEELKLISGEGQGPESAEETLVQNSEESETRHALEALSAEGFTPDQIAVLRLRAIDEEEYEAIARVLRKSPANVRKIYSRALEKLKQISWRPARRRSEG